ncbi:cyclophilin-like fold protein [Streptococcus gallolyticus]|uniref:Cyclophilin-like domain-containing protein n=1 Tax=Streptococcus gallolyticus TaxID=315405 RepID=A0A1H9Q4U4_9STRE|nr:cyclophilin-like fold protein [Streptococcus gallolyticus]SER55460.1 hypothetical protein SAMN04487840_10546 [Streptococcus gallolyticus]
MKKFGCFILVMMLLVLSACSSVQDNQQAKQTQTTTTSKTEEEKMVTATVNGETFTITLNQSQAAQEFLNLLPLTLDMRDVNGNEKYAVLNQTFTNDDKKAGTIHAGDLKLWSGDGLVLFYDDFLSSYQYTDLGTMSDSQGLAEALEAGDVTITFEVIE